MMTVYGQLSLWAAHVLFYTNGFKASERRKCYYVA